MKHIILIIPVISIIVQAHAQAPLVKVLDKRFGTVGNDYLFSFQLTNDGGYILGGTTSSGISGDKTQQAWDTNGDYWIVKIDSIANLQWERRFGGTYIDELQCLQQTKDGGYILGGNSSSGISGDKTEGNWGPFGADYWIVKTDSIGNKQWDKRFGGEQDDQLHSLLQTRDGGFILGGASFSGNSGDRTQQSWGGFDFWVVKVDSLGNKQWDKRFGSNEWDNLYSIQQTNDGGFILGGASNSDHGADITHANKDPFNSTYDYWILKTDAFGNKQWDARYGGSDNDHLTSLQQTKDKGYILGGVSSSSAGGDKTEPSWNGSGDYWIVKVDSVGKKQWDRVFGGSGSEPELELGTVSQTIDGGYLLAGSSYSNASGNKSENNLGEEQGWIVKTDSLGNMQWDKTIFTLGHDEFSNALQTKEGCYVIANFSDSGIGGYKTQSNWDLSNSSYDYWIIKFRDTTFISPCSSFGITTNSVTAQVTCYGAHDGAAKAVASGGTPSYTFLWSDGQTTNTPTSFPAGVHSVTVTDNNGCTATTSITIAEGELPCTGIQENSLNNISLYPNPTSGTVILKAKGELSLKLYDALGRQLNLTPNPSPAGEGQGRGITLDLNSFPGSVFFLHIRTEAGSRVLKVIKY